MCRTPTSHPLPSLGLGDKVPHSLCDGVPVNAKHLQQLSCFPLLGISPTARRETVMPGSPTKAEDTASPMPPGKGKGGGWSQAMWSQGGRWGRACSSALCLSQHFPSPRTTEPARTPPSLRPAAGADTIHPSPPCFFLSPNVVSESRLTPSSGQLPQMNEHLSLTPVYAHLSLVESLPWRRGAVCLWRAAWRRTREDRNSVLLSQLDSSQQAQCPTLSGT